jgi:DNA polymerase family A
VTTIFGRKCHYPRVTASNPSERAFNDRAAINARIQGSAADIIRCEMGRMDEALETILISTAFWKGHTRAMANSTNAIGSNTMRAKLIRALLTKPEKPYSLSWRIDLHWRSGAYPDTPRYSQTVITQIPACLRSPSRKVTNFHE